jgi:hypothetical protein
METKGYVEKFYIYKVASLPLEVMLRPWLAYSHSIFLGSVLVAFHEPLNIITKNEISLFGEKLSEFLLSVPVPRE